MRVGILGGGQLGCMLADSLHALGATVALFEPDAAAPAHARFAHTTCAPFTDLTALSAFFSSCDAVTYESENVPIDPLIALGDSALVKLLPGLSVLRITQDRAEEKSFFLRNRLPCARTLVLESISDLPLAAPQLGFPFILKTARGGYDGKGQWRIESLSDLGGLAPLRDHAPGRFVIEEVVDLQGEISVIVARRAGPDGERIELFPPFENVHRSHILDLTLLPASLTPGQRALAQDLAIQTAQAIDLNGLLTVEFFLARTAGQGVPAEADGLHLRLNELAPRPHNSGHVTRKACTLSQFDQLARILVGLDPAAATLHPGGWAMAQLLGAVWADRTALELRPLNDHPAVIELMDYGKTTVRPTRKMGHLIAHAPTPAEAAEQALSARRALSRGHS